MVFCVNCWVRSFTDIIIGSTSLKVLDVGQNSVGDAGMTLILDALQHSKSLVKLRVDQCKLTAKGLYYLR